jgi:probable rRNA maturation factor
VSATVRNLQDRPALAAWQIDTVAKVAFAEAGRSGTLGVAFVDDSRMAAYHEQFMGDPSTTDVLSFPAADEDAYLGDVIVCTDQAVRQAAELGLPYVAELVVLVLHGCLHLVGYDHEVDNGVMTRIEERLRPQVLRLSSC